MTVTATGNSTMPVTDNASVTVTTPEYWPVAPPEDLPVAPSDYLPVTPPEYLPSALRIPTFVVVLIPVASLIIIVSMALCFYRIWNRRNGDPLPNRAPGKPEMPLAAPSISGKEIELPGILVLSSSNLKSYAFQDLAESTGSFSHSNLLGRGGFGEVYKGKLADGQIAAIKKLTRQAEQKEEDFMAEISAVGRVHHEHLVKLLGYCYDNESNRLLVYEYVPNNSLRSHLHGEDKPGEDKPILSWCNRIKIAIGTAKGLEYLHRCNPKIIHRDIKADNILLDDNFEPKIADFGLAKDCSYSVTHISTDPKGTFGYFAPEYAKDRKLTDKSDVFSFGVVLLELITGRKSVFFEGKNALNLAEWVIPHIEKALQSGNYDEFVDPKLEEKDTHENELARMTYCAAACVYKPASDRPDISQIVEALRGNISLKQIWNNSDNRFFYDSSGKRRELYGISDF